MYIGELILKYRNSFTPKLSQRAFAKRTSLSASYINTLEKVFNPKTGKPYSVTIEATAEIAKAMNLSVDELLKQLELNQEFIINSSENKLLQLQKYMEEKNLDEIALIPVFDDIDLKDNWQTNPTGYTPFDFKIQNCFEDRNYFYYKISDNSMNIEIDTYILIEDTQDVNINDIILYSLNNKIDLGIYQITLKKEKNFKILGKYIK